MSQDLTIRPQFTAEDVANYVAEYLAKPGNSLGGNLHAVLSDENVDRDSIYFCYGYASAKHDDLGCRLSNLLLGLTTKGRIRAIRLGREKCRTDAQV